MPNDGQGFQGFSNEDDDGRGSGFLTDILAFLLKSKGFDGHHYKRNYVKRRIAVRMRATGSSNYREYLKVLQGNRRSHPSFDRLTIHVTEFFRDPEVYQAILKKVLPSFSNLPGFKLRVWCAGCSTGEEPYSVGMLLEEWAITQPGFAYEILATDIDAPACARRVKGIIRLNPCESFPMPRGRVGFIWTFLGPGFRRIEKTGAVPRA